MDKCNHKPVPKPSGGRFFAECTRCGARTDQNYFKPMFALKAFKEQFERGDEDDTSS